MERDIDSKGKDMAAEPYSFAVLPNGDTLPLPTVRRPQARVVQADRDGIFREIRESIRQSDIEKTFVDIVERTMIGLYTTLADAGHFVKDIQLKNKIVYADITPCVLSLGTQMQLVRFVHNIENVRVDTLNGPLEGHTRLTRVALTLCPILCDACQQATERDVATLEPPAKRPRAE